MPTGITTFADGFVLKSEYLWFDSTSQTIT